MVLVVISLLSWQCKALLRCVFNLKVRQVMIVVEVMMIQNKLVQSWLVPEIMKVTLTLFLYVFIRCIVVFCAFSRYFVQWSFIKVLLILHNWELSIVAQKFYGSGCYSITVLVMFFNTLGGINPEGWNLWDKTKLEWLDVIITRNRW